MPWPSASTRATQRSGWRSVDGGVARAGNHDPAVRARPDAGIFAVAPVEQVVAAFLAGGGVVGDLVGRQARRLRQLLRQLVEIVRQLAVGHPQLAAGMELGERRARLDGELIERQVPARQRQGARQLVFARLAGSGRAGRRSGRRTNAEISHARRRSPPMPPRPCAAGPMPASRPPRGTARRATRG